MHELFLDRTAVKDLAALPLGLRRRIRRKLEASKKRPHRYFLRLRGKQTYRLRVGAYRIFADIDDTIIFVTAVKHRRDAYGRYHLATEIFHTIRRFYNFFGEAPKSGKTHRTAMLTAFLAACLSALDTNLSKAVLFTSRRSISPRNATPVTDCFSTRRRFS